MGRKHTRSEPVGVAARCAAAVAEGVRLVLQSGALAKISNLRACKGSQGSHESRPCIQNSKHKSLLSANKAFCA